MGTSRRSRARREAEGTEHGADRVSDDRLVGAAALGAALTAGLFLVACLLALLAWPAPSTAKEKGFVAAAKEQVRSSVAALKSLTLPEFVAQVAARLRDEGVDARVEDGGTRLVLGGTTAHFARGSAIPSSAARGDLEAFSRALSWGLSCYVEPAAAAAAPRAGAGATDATAAKTVDPSRCGSAPSFRCDPGYAPFAFKGLEFRGHTDAVPYRDPGPGRNNADLSVARADSGKTVVEGCLSPSTSLPGLALGTVGRADGEPRVAPPEAPGNRRVEIRFLE